MWTEDAQVIEAIREDLHGAVTLYEADGEVTLQVDQFLRAARLRISKEQIKSIPGTDLCKALRDINVWCRDSGRDSQQMYYALNRAEVWIGKLLQ